MKDFIKFIIWMSLFWIGFVAYIRSTGNSGVLYWTGISILGIWLGWTWDKLNK